MNKPLFYFFDPLCGWCYGALPKLQKIAENRPLVLLPTGLFADSGRTMNAEFADYAWQNDQRIAQLTGQPFSQAYREQVLQRATAFDSKNLITALTAVQQTAPEQELTALTALQRARYVDGKDNTQWTVIRDILRDLGLTAAVDLLDSPSLAAQTAERIRQARQLFQQLGLQGVPNLLEQSENGWRKVPSEQLFG